MPRIERLRRHGENHRDTSEICLGHTHRLEHLHRHGEKLRRHLSKSACPKLNTCADTGKNHRDTLKSACPKLNTCTETRNTTQTPLKICMPRTEHLHRHGEHHRDTSENCMFNPYRSCPFDKAVSTVFLLSSFCSRVQCNS